MRLPDDGLRRAFTLGLTMCLAACGGVGNASRAESASAKAVKAEQPSRALAANGPAADYPVEIGDAYRIDGIEYVPADTLNYDEVGYVMLGSGAGVTVAHKTLPVPSYVEVTSLENGKTILARVESRGPLVNDRLVTLSVGAQELIGASEGSPVRVRRVNPPEAERFLLRAGDAASARLDTPMSLVEILKRKLPVVGSASLAAPTPAEAPNLAVNETPKVEESPKKIAVEDTFDEILPAPKPDKKDSTPAVVAGAGKGDFVIQAAAFSSKANAEKAAKLLSGFVESSGRLFRVRTGPYETRGQADAALAKVKAAGYSDARVVKAG